MTKTFYKFLLGKKVFIALLSVLVTFNVIDIYEYLIDGASFALIIEETIIVIVFISIIVYLMKDLIKSKYQLTILETELANIKFIHQKQSEKMNLARKSYTEIINEQFKEWQLTKSEQEVGFLLLKGLSLDEIASIRGTKEKTARQQSSNIYSKAGVSGRHEFAGWFFEDR
ncbi:MAG: LuxR family transcriptional regulator [Kangiellaceae bacterium]|jgi:DNA-binding CsgD family transcriptional regulator|nr:LuxR family transcriptional regulator [Kangiellaceae bacterium]